MVGEMTSIRAIHYSGENPHVTHFLHHVPLGWCGASLFCELSATSETEFQDSNQGHPCTVCPTQSWLTLFPSAAWSRPRPRSKCIMGEWSETLC